MVWRQHQQVVFSLATEKLNIGLILHTDKRISEYWKLCCFIHSCNYRTNVKELDLNIYCVHFITFIALLVSTCSLRNR